MLKISFPDGRTQTFKKELNGFEIAESISNLFQKSSCDESRWNFNGFM